MITITTEKVGGIDRVIITANDFNLTVIGAPDNPLALLRLVNSGGDVTGYYRYIANAWVFVGYGLSNLNEASGSPSGGIDLSSATPLSLPIQPTDTILATRDGTILSKVAFSDLQSAIFGHKTFTQAELNAGINLSGITSIVCEPLTANLVIATPSNPQPYTDYTWDFEGGNGGFTVTFPNGISFPAIPAGMGLTVKFRHTTNNNYRYIGA